jgi:flagellin
MGMAIQTGFTALLAQQRATNAANASAPAEVTRTRYSCCSQTACVHSDISAVEKAKPQKTSAPVTDRYAAQVQGEPQPLRAAHEDITRLQKADSTLDTIADDLLHMRELASRAAQPEGKANRAALQQQFGQLAGHIDRLAAITESNGQKVFDQSRERMAGYANENEGAVLHGLQGGWLENAEQMISNRYGLTADGEPIDIHISGYSDGQGGVAAYVQTEEFDDNGRGTGLSMQVDIADFSPANLPNGGHGPFYNDRVIAHEMVHAVMARTTNWKDIVTKNLWFAEGSAEFIHGADERVKSDLKRQGMDVVVNAINGPKDNSHFYSGSYSAVRYLHERIKEAGGNGLRDVMVHMNKNPKATLDDAIATASRGEFKNAEDFKTQFIANGAEFIASFDLDNADTGAIGGLDVDGGAEMTAESVVNDDGRIRGDDVLTGFTESWEELERADGSNRKTQQGMQAKPRDPKTLTSVNLDALSLRKADISTAEKAADAVRKIDEALDYIGNSRNRVGVQITQLQDSVRRMGPGDTAVAQGDDKAGKSTSKPAVAAAAMGATASAQTVAQAASVAERARAQMMRSADVAMAAQGRNLPTSVLSLLA